MGLTSWFRRSPVERDTECECGHRCIYTRNSRRLPFCDKYAADSPDALKKYDREAFRDCLEIGTCSPPVGVKDGNGTKFFYECTRSDG